jgi:hypothetical protein
MGEPYGFHDGPAAPSKPIFTSAGLEMIQEFSVLAGDAWNRFMPLGLVGDFPSLLGRISRSP